MTKTLPSWADELRRRYLRGEASLFVLHGNVHDTILSGGNLSSVSDFLSHSVLEKKDILIRYNVSTGCRFVRKTGKIDALEELLLQRSPEKVLPVLERLLYLGNNVGLIVEHAEMVAPAGDVTFFSEQDRMSVVTLQRWSLARELEASDNVVLLLTEVPSELHPKIVANPRVAAVRIPMPTLDERREIVRHVNPTLDPGWVDCLADITSGLKGVQIKSILSPPPPGEEDAESRFRFIKSLVGDEGRARKLAALTQGMSREEIQDLIGVKAPAGNGVEKSSALDDVLRLISKRKRETIERECFGLIEFVDSAHDFGVVGGIEEVKKELSLVAKNIREGRRSRVPMGFLFTGPMGTGKTFVAEAFVKESGLTGIKLKNFRSKWVGATESNLERILGVVQGIGNVVVIIDEADRSFGSGGDEGDGDGGTSSRVVARIKEFMSDTSNRGRVLFVLMTNRPDKLDIDIKRAGRLDRKIPFLYPQSAEEVEHVLLALVRKHRLKTNVEFPRDREALSAHIVGYSNADFEALVLLAHDRALEKGETDPTLALEHFQQAIGDYLPSRDVEMLEYMELLAVFEASNRRMLPAKYAGMTVDDLQQRLAQLKLSCAGRR
ncbi:MAG: ATP-binding protein [Deltaproteobacteria bacterium]|nr:ATP-binding protein [Deltaproteobacteria bacterium]